jgi:hypothetical protein
LSVDESTDIIATEFSIVALAVAVDRGRPGDMGKENASTAGRMETASSEKERDSAGVALDLREGRIAGVDTGAAADPRIWRGRESFGR